MAKILLSLSCNISYTEYKNNKLIIFYESLCNELVKNGNDVLVYNKAFFNNLYVTNTIDSMKLQNQIQDFNPDLIISFNHVLPPNIKSYTNCPTIVWAADLPWYWENKEDALSNTKNIFIVNNSSSLVESLMESGAKHVYNIPLATSVQSEPLEQTKNISFIGTLFPHKNTPSFLKEFPELKENLTHLVQDFSSNNCYNRELLFNKYNLSETLNTQKNSETLFYELTDLRLSTVAVLLELGIEIYGFGWDIASKDFWSQLYLAFNPQKVYTLKHNQDIYNSSKLALNINHPQAGTELFSWRVYDILASNACILAQKNAAIHAFLKPYIDLPMFESPSESFYLAKKLLDSPAWRQEIVEACQLFIKEHGRWDHSIKKLYEASGVSIYNPTTKENGKMQFLIADEFKVAQEERETSIFITKTKNLLKKILSKKQKDFIKNFQTKIIKKFR